MLLNCHADTSIHFLEGHVGHYDKLIVNRPNAININAALSNETNTYHYLHHMKVRILETRLMCHKFVILTIHASIMQPSPVDGILEFMEEKFIKKCHKM